MAHYRAAQGKLQFITGVLLWRWIRFTPAGGSVIIQPMMTRAGRSIFVFGFWVLACALPLMIFPGLLLGYLGIPSSAEVVARVFGMVLLFLAIYYLVTGRRAEFAPFFRVTVYTRASALLIVTLIVLLTGASPLIILFTVVDALGALWTALALRLDRRHARG
jgi:uncharacterized membrane protein YuzA (DUF378 family)